MKQKILLTCLAVVVIVAGATNAQDAKNESDTGTGESRDFDTASNAIAEGRTGALSGLIRHKIHGIHSLLGQSHLHVYATKGLHGPKYPHHSHGHSHGHSLGHSHGHGHGHAYEQGNGWGWNSPEVVFHSVGGDSNNGWGWPTVTSNYDPTSTSGHGGSGWSPGSGSGHQWSPGAGPGNGWDQSSNNGGSGWSSSAGHGNGWDQSSSQISGNKLSPSAGQGNEMVQSEGQMEELSNQVEHGNGSEMDAGGSGNTEPRSEGWGWAAGATIHETVPAVPRESEAHQNQNPRYPRTQYMNY